MQLNKVTTVHLIDAPQYFLIHEKPLLLSNNDALNSPLHAKIPITHKYIRQDKKFIVYLLQLHYKSPASKLIDTIIIYKYEIKHDGKTKLHVNIPVQQ